VTPDELKADPDTNGALADFQFYATRMQKLLHVAGIDLKEIYAKSFQVQRETPITTFRPGKADAEYSFGVPDKEQRIEYGVVTDADLLLIAKEYFDQTLVSTSCEKPGCAWFRLG
jgi:hypothetical protein